MGECIGFYIDYEKVKVLNHRADHLNRLMEIVAQDFIVEFGALERLRGYALKKHHVYAVAGSTELHTEFEDV